MTTTKSTTEGVVHLNKRSLKTMLVAMISKIVNDREKKMEDWKSCVTYEIDIKYNNKDVRVSIIIKLLDKLVSFTYVDDINNLTVNVYGHKREEIEIMLLRAVNVYMAALEMNAINNRDRPMVITVYRKKASEKLLKILNEKDDDLKIEEMIDIISGLEFIDGFCYSSFEEFREYTANKSHPYVSSLRQAIVEYEVRLLVAPALRDVSGTDILS